MNAVQQKKGVPQKCFVTKVMSSHAHTYTRTDLQNGFRVIVCQYSL